MDVNKRLEELLAQRGWTRYRLSKESGVPETTLTNIFYRGTVPTIATLEQICDTLGVTLSQFFADGDVVEMTEDLDTEEVVASICANLHGKIPVREDTVSYVQSLD